MRGLNQHFKRAGNKNTPSGGEGSGLAVKTVISRRSRRGGDGGNEERKERAEFSGVLNGVCVSRHTVGLFVSKLF